jgi:DNA-binding transcriptional LysR family regulator
MGITSTTIWACQQELDSGALVRLLTDWNTVDLPVNAYFPLGRATRKVARAFVDFIGAALLAEPAA